MMPVAGTTDGEHPSRARTRRMTAADTPDATRADDGRGEDARISAEDVKAKWFSPDGVGLTHDHQTDRVVVTMRDGSEFWCTFAEHSALLAGDTP